MINQIKNWVKGNKEMAKEIQVKDMVKSFKRGMPFKVSSVNVPSFKYGSSVFDIIRDSKFISEEIIVTKLSVIEKKYIQFNYIDNKNIEHAITVPPEFMLKSPTKTKEKQLVKRYQEFLMKNLSSQLNFYTTIGCDPELFVTNEKDELIPAFEFLGSKAKPSIVSWPHMGSSLPKLNLKDVGQTDYNDIYWDGFQAEFTTKNVGTCMDGLAGYIRSGLWGIMTAAKLYNPKAKLSLKTVMNVSFEELKKAAPEHVAFGCMKSLNAYGMAGKDLPGEDVLFRPAGGHIHLGIGKKTKEEYENIVKSMDAILGVACVSLFAKYDDPRRRELYGLAGEYRLPPHGLEYRVLSNAWLSHPLIAHLVYDLARTSAAMGANNFMHLWEHDEKETVRIINSCDVKAARRLLRKNKEVFLKVINGRYHEEASTKAKFVYNIILKGLESAVVEPENIEKNWGLDYNKDWFFIRVREAHLRKGKV